MMAGGLKWPLFLFLKTIEKEIRLCTVLIFFFIGSFEDRAIFHVIQLSYDGGGGFMGPKLGIYKWV